VTNVNEGPTDITLSATSVAENAAVGTAVGTLSTTDVDAGDIFTYTLVSGTGSTDNASFTIDGSTLKTAASFNFEAKSNYAVRIRSTDAGGLFTEKTFTISVTNVNEAPTVTVPDGFMIVEDTTTGLVFTGTPFADPDLTTAKVTTVTLGVADGVIAATTANGVTVAGTAVARTFSGTIAALNTYFKASPARITYTPAANSTAARTLTTTISESDGVGTQSSSATSSIAITPVNDAPTLNPAAILAGGKVGTRYVMTYAALRAALNVADVDPASPSIVIQSVDSGTVQKWNGTAWVTVSTAAQSTLVQRSVSVGGKLRWLPPTGVSGGRLAFKLKAWDGSLYSAVTAQVTINLASA
jgi:hypothetical protein